jgi:hypothetical protein
LINQIELFWKEYALASGHHGLYVIVYLGLLDGGLELDWECLGYNNILSGVANPIDYITQME